MTAVLLIAVPVQANEVSSVDLFDLWNKFNLWNKCEPLGLLVEDLSKDAKETGLTKDRITRSVRSRLRGARIYREDELLIGAYVYVRINVVSNAFSIDVQLKKIVQDWISTQTSYATTWETSSTGTHGGNSGFIINSLGEHTDIFIDEYLRVNNSDSCNAK